MYTPEEYRIDDAEIVRDFIGRHGFGIVLSVAGGAIHDTHLPLVLSGDGAFLLGHMSLMNEQWKGWVENPAVKVIFHGPHTYISPRYYKGDRYVPTWNYTAVSVTGTVEIVDDPEEAAELVRMLIAFHESGFPDPWQADMTSRRILNQLRGVVCFRIRIEHFEAKFKLNQDKPEEDRLSVIAHLRASDDPMDRMVAALMER